ncbi:sucrose-proton symporter 7 [Striga asiatica]|uniref:Sucrose-proton symporter 7 n=1 Tax=Striga asiatica TaxID=4170 RepID=A0A5A7QL54_STRAF|nr:sucrose-proton symporter 7 [Striga asiatica]
MEGLFGGQRALLLLARTVALLGDDGWSPEGGSRLLTSRLWGGRRWQHVALKLTAMAARRGSVHKVRPTLLCLHTWAKSDSIKDLAVQPSVKSDLFRAAENDSTKSPTAKPLPAAIVRSLIRQITVWRIRRGIGRSSRCRRRLVIPGRRRRRSQIRFEQLLGQQHLVEFINCQLLLVDQRSNNLGRHDTGLDGHKTENDSTKSPTAKPLPAVIISLIRRITVWRIRRGVRRGIGRSSRRRRRLVIPRRLRRLCIGFGTRSRRRRRRQIRFEQLLGQQYLIQLINCQLLLVEQRSNNLGRHDTRLDGHSAAVVLHREIVFFRAVSGQCVEYSVARFQSRERFVDRNPVVLEYRLLIVCAQILIIFRQEFLHRVVAGAENPCGLSRSVSAKILQSVADMRAVRFSGAGAGDGASASGEAMRDEIWMTERLYGMD